MPRTTRLSRRGFLNIGALGWGFGGLSLSSLLQAEATAGVRASRKSVIFIYLVGGPPHQDMFDLKPKAPAEVAGPWRPIPTNVPGIEICEAFPRLARMMDKFAIVRSLVGNQADHDAVQVFNGRDPRKPRPTGGWPQLGSVVARLQGPSTRRCPRSSASAIPARTRRTTSPAPASSGRRSPRSGRPAPAARTWACTISGRPPGRPQGPAEELDASDDTPTPAGRSGRWTPSTSRRSGCSPRRRSPRRSTSRRKTPVPSSATAPATRRCSWTTTVRRACRKAC